MNWHAAVERTVTGLGYDLVDCERSSQGLLRVFIDRVPGQPYETGDGEFITVDDCEKVTRQLQYVLEVENADYARLEVSSPGLDRPLRKERDFARFAGQKAEVRMRTPDATGRRKFVGVLRGAQAGQLSLEMDGRVLALPVDDVDKAKLVPEL
jgi:ribosome maturation factor RimP